jgi:hypothetical protein
VVTVTTDHHSDLPRLVMLAPGASRSKRKTMSAPLTKSSRAAIRKRSMLPRRNSTRIRRRLKRTRTGGISTASRPSGWVRR